MVFSSLAVCACGFRSSVWGQHPERPLFSPSGSVPRFWSFHRRFSAGCSSRCAVWLHRLPDDTRLTQWHLRWVLPSLLLRRLAGQQADLTSSGKTNAPYSNSQLAAVSVYFLILLSPVFVRFWCLQKNVPGRSWAARLATASWTPSAASLWSSPLSCCQHQPMRSKLWVTSRLLNPSLTLVVVLSDHFVTKHPVWPLRFQQLWSSWSSPTPTQRCPSTCPSIVGPCTPCWVEPASASRPNTLWGGWMPGIPARATAVRPPGTSVLKMWRRLPVFFGPQVQGSALWLLTTQGCIMKSSCSCLCTKNVGQQIPSI